MFTVFLIDDDAGVLKPARRAACQAVTARTFKSRAAQSFRPVRICAILLTAATLTCACGLAPASDARAQERAPRVLVLNAYNYTFPGTTIIGTAARQHLVDRTRGNIEIDTDFLDLLRHPGPGYEQRTATYLSEKYAAKPPDVLVALGSPALPFIIRNRAIIAAKAPVVFAGISQANYSEARPPPDITGVISTFDIARTLDLAERLQPDARQLVVIAGASETDRRWQRIAPDIVKARGRLQARYLFGLRFEDMLAEVSQLPRNAIVLLLTVFTDGEGKTFFPGDVAEAVASRSSAPVYSPYSHDLARGVIGGYSETFESIGEAAADLVMRILSGTPASELPPWVSPHQRFRVNAQALRKWDLSESLLPPETIVQFKLPTLWDQHRGVVLTTVAIVVLQLLFVIGLLIQRRHRYLAERLLRESEERMQFTAAAVNVGLWQFDLEANELWATEHCRALFGLPDDVPLTHDMFIEAVHPDDRAIAVAALEEASRPGRSAFTDVRVPQPGDQMRWVRVRAHSHRDEGGNPNHVNGIFVDITEQKAAEAEAVLQRQEVAHLMRVSVLGQLSGAIAHEVNQPLTAILSNAQAALHLLAQESPDLVEVRSALQDIVEEDNRAGKVVHRLRGLLKKNEKKSEPVDVNDLVRSTVALLHSELIGRGINVEVDLASTLPATVGDPVQLQQVLLNLLMNAMDAMATTPAAQRLVMLSTRPTEAMSVEILVKDHGPGIRSTEQGRLFEPFYTTKPHGLGLGLTICSTIVEAHGGTLTLANDEAGGVLAALSLPVQEMLVAAQ
jgi:PAS domain S-box-containing protein